jgi:hypothetical protein
MPPSPAPAISDSVASTETLVNEKIATDEKPDGDKPTPSPDDFIRFLLLNPYVVDGNIWSDYYSKQTMMSLEAKAAMVLPDKKPLPNVVVRDIIPFNLV